MDEQQWLTCDMFVGLVGDDFEVGTQGTLPMTVQLTEATEGSGPGGVGPDGQARRQFALLFRGPVEPVLPQAIHRLSHRELGDLDVFLVPIGPDAVGMRYEAVFG